MAIHTSELGDRLDTNPQSLVGQTYLGYLQPMQDDGGYYVLYDDYLIVVDFDRTILEVIERDS